MSSITVSGNASGTGIFTIASPNSNTNRTLTLPDNTGTFITTGSSGQSIPRAALPTGSVLQVVQGTTSTQVLISGSTYTDTGLSASITPSSASSKILVLVSQSMQTQITSNADAITAYRIVRDSTTVTTFNRIQGIRSATGQDGFAINIGYVSPIYLDSPNTTSSITYKTQFSLTSGANSIANSAGTVSYITLMEIAA